MLFAPPPPAIVQPNAADNELGTIEILGRRADQALKIDRRTYRVKDNPHSAQADSLQLLRGLPAVTITADQQIMLLGAANVSVLVDDRPIHGDATQYLRTLHGSDIERIEIITSPSAQYSPDGTGGIINIVLKKKRQDGLTGSASAEASSIGRIEGSATFKDKHGKWIYEIELQGGVGRGSVSSYHKDRQVEPFAGAPATINTEDGRGSARDTFSFGSFKLTRTIDDRTSVSASMFGGSFTNRTENEARYVGVTPDFRSFDENQNGRQAIRFVGAELSLDHKGKTDGETLKGTLRLFGNPTNHRSFAAVSDVAGDFATNRSEPNLFADAQIDWQHPIGKDRIVSTGASWTFADALWRYQFSQNGSTLSLPEAIDSYQTRSNKFAAYATYQQQFGSWTIMPGVRLEHYRRRIASLGRPPVNIVTTAVFPTFHLDHPLSKTINLTLSYSKRIDRARADQLRPYPIVLGVDLIGVGIPLLRDQSTDAFEVNLHYHRKQIDAGVIIYDRETSDLWANSYSTNGRGLSIITSINSGRSAERGAEFDITAPLMHRVKATASVNLFDSRVPSDPLLGNGRVDESFRSTANGTIEWAGPDHGGKPGDIGQLQMTYESPRRSFQIDYRATYSFSLSYTHSFSRNLLVTASINDIGPSHNRHRLNAPLVQEYYDRRERVPTLKVKLSRTIGKSK